MIDAAVVAKRCDGTVLVVESNAVNYRFVQKVKEQLDKSGSRILGVVLNKVDLNKKGYYGHYGKYYGKYYGRYGNDADARPASPSSHKPETAERAERVTRPEMTDRPDRIRHLGETEKKTVNERL